ncbi:redoxin domain-containing protein [Planctomycetes bacterium K23_9]
MSRFIPIVYSTLLGTLLVAGATVADDPPAKKKSGEATTQKDDQPSFKLSKDVEEVLLPLFRSIAKADVSRATVELNAETFSNGSVVDRKKSTYQIASTHPNKFTVYLKQPDQRTRLYCDGKDFFAAVAPDAFFRLPEPIDLFNAVFEMPVPMGPYPEAVFALTFAGADPALSLLGGMESVEIVDRGKFRGSIPAVHLKGVQDDGVVWDFWISQEKEPKPLRLSVNLTRMLRDNAQMRMEQGVSYELRYDFLTWRVSGKVDEKLFKYDPPKDATEFKSLDDYYAKIAQDNSRHPLLGKKAPQFEAELLNGKVLGPKQLQGKVVVIDFWATWCSPCVEAMPVLQQVCDEFADKDVVLLAINVGEDTKKIKEFVKKQGWKLNVVLDDQMEVSKGFNAEVIPLTMLVSKAGIVESMHFGFPGAEPLKQRLTDELEVLTLGGVIETATPQEKKKKAADGKAAQTKKAASTPARKTTAKKK